LVPHRYLIKLSAHDKENLSDQLLRAISSEVANYAGEKSYQLTGDLELKISADSGVQKGRIQVGSAAVGSLVSWKPIISYGSERRELSSGTTTFGRDDSADVAIDDRGLSRVHFEIAFNGDIAAIRDLQSTNGTFVDGMRVQEVVLRSGSKISAGRTEFDFELIALTGGSSE
jgi:pSer/pThr/pTyr-binding forkhead associated (FHA) protein